MRGHAARFNIPERIRGVLRSYPQRTKDIAHKVGINPMSAAVFLKRMAEVGEVKEITIRSERSVRVSAWQKICTSTPNPPAN
jgi:hypothetical protein